MQKRESSPMKMNKKLVSKGTDYGLMVPGKKYLRSKRGKKMKPITL